jgi:O-antigen/teichoic acid export membrane protein
LNLINKKNLLWNSGSFILISVLGFLNFTLNLKTYDSDVFGFYLLLSAYWGFGGSIDFGFGVSSIKNISEAVKVKDTYRIKKIINTFFLTYFIFAVLIIAIICFIFFVYNSLNTNVYLRFDINVVLLLFAFGFLFRYLSGFLLIVFEGLSEFILLSKINLSLTIFNTIQTTIIYIFKLPLYYLILSQFTYNFFLFITLYFFLKIQKKYFLTFGLKYIDFKLLKKDGIYNLNLQISFIFNTLIDPLLKTIMSTYLGLQYITYFETAKKIINLTNGLINSALKGLLNRISEANVVGELKQFINEQIYQYSNLALDYTVIAYGVLNPVLCILILLWFNSYESMIVFLLFLLPYSFINIGGPFYSVLMIEGKGGKLALLQFINLTVMCLIFYFSVTISNSYLGLIGFYFATLINIYLMIYFLKKYIGLNIKILWKNIDAINLLILNVILIIQLIACLIFSKYVYYVLILFCPVYIIIFRKKILFYFTYLYKNIITLVSKKKLKTQ